MVQTSFGSGGEIVYNVRVDTSGLEKEVSSLLDNFTKLEQIALRYLTIARRMGLPEDIDNAIQAIAKLIVVLNQVRLTVGLLNAEMGPIGWLSYAASAGLTALSISDTAGSFI